MAEIEKSAASGIDVEALTHVMNLMQNDPGQFAEFAQEYAVAATHEEDENGEDNGEDVVPSYAEEEYGEELEAMNSELRDILSDESATIPVMVKVPFHWKVNSAIPVPSKTTLSPQLLAKVSENIEKVHGVKLDLAEPIAIHSMKIKASNVKAPYDLHLTATDPKGNVISNFVDNVDGQDYTALLPTGYCDKEHVIFAMDLSQPHTLMSIENVDFDKEIRSASLITGTDQIMFAAESGLGNLLSNAPEFQTDDELTAAYADAQGKVCSTKDKIKELRNMYHSAAVENSSKGKIGDIIVSVSRAASAFDDKENEEKSSSFSAENAPQVSKAQARNLDTATNEAYVMLQFNVIHPNVLSAYGLQTF